MTDVDHGLVLLYLSSSEQRCRERSLVLQAAGIPHEVQSRAGGFAILVTAQDHPEARAELDGYDSEAETVPPGPRSQPYPKGGWSGVAAYVAVLTLFGVLQGADAGGFDWSRIGRTDAQLIRNGQWWRSLTALTLHADAGHLLSNLVFGGLFGLFAGKSFGSGLAWLCILLAGGLGNFVNAWLRPTGHTSVGASTAVFAAVGLLVSYAWRQEPGDAHVGLRRWAPLIGGLLLVSFLGTGGARTDVAAHALGFICGALVGAGARVLPPAVFKVTGQRVLAVVALTLLAAAWLIALLPYLARG